MIATYQKRTHALLACLQHDKHANSMESLLEIATQIQFPFGALISGLLLVQVSDF